MSINPSLEWMGESLPLGIESAILGTFYLTLNGHRSKDIWFLTITSGWSLVGKSGLVASDADSGSCDDWCALRFLVGRQLESVKFEHPDGTFPTFDLSGGLRLYVDTDIEDEAYTFSMGPSSFTYMRRD